MSHFIANSAIVSATIYQDIPTLTSYYNSGVDLNNIYDSYGDSLVHLAIEHNNYQTFTTLLDWGLDVNQKSPDYEMTPLNYAAIFGYTNYVQPLVDHGAELNTVDYDDCTPVLNAMWFDNYDTANYLLTFNEVDVNISSYGHITPLEMAYFDGQTSTVQLVLDHPSFNPTYNYLNMLGQSYCEDIEQVMISAGYEIDYQVLEVFDTIKLFGLRYDMAGDFSLISIGAEGQYSFSHEGYMNFAGINGFYHAYEDYQHNVVDYANLPGWGNSMFAAVYEALAFSASTEDSSAFIMQYELGKPILVTSGWDGHSIVFVIHGDRLYRCNRGHLSEDNSGIEEYKIHKLENLNADLINYMIKAEGEPDYLQYDLIEILGLEKTGIVETEMQTVGNCVWTSIEAGLESLMITTLLDMGLDSESAHILAKQNYLLWESYDLTLGVNEIMHYSDYLIENNMYDDLLLQALNSHHDFNDSYDVGRGVLILNELTEPNLMDSFEQHIGDNVNQYDLYSSQQTDYMNSYDQELGAFDWFLNSIGYYTWGMSRADYDIGREYHDFLIACDQADIIDDVYTLALTDIFMPFNGDIVFDSAPNDPFIELPLQMMPMYQEELDPQMIYI